MKVGTAADPNLKLAPKRGLLASEHIDVSLRPGRALSLLEGLSE